MEFREDQQDFAQILEDLPESGAWIWNAARPEAILWSPGMYRIFGLSQQTEPSVDLLFDRVHPGDQSLVARFIEGARGGLAATPLSVEHRIMRPNGEVRWVIARVRPQPRGDGGVDRLLGTIQDISEQRRAEQEIRAYRAVTEALANWGDFEASARSLLQGLAEPLGWQIGGLWYSGYGHEMACRVLWAEQALADSAFARRTAELKFSAREGIPGAVWSERAAANVEDLAVHPDFVRRAEASEAGLRSAFAFPALFDGEPLAVFEFYGPEPGRLTHRLSETLTGIGRQIGTFLSRHRAELEDLRLSQREREVLELAAAGRTTTRIAEELYISPATVKTHFERISKRLDVHDRTAAVALALRQGLIS